MDTRRGATKKQNKYIFLICRDTFLQFFIYILHIYIKQIKLDIDNLYMTSQMSHAKDRCNSLLLLLISSPSPSLLSPPPLLLLLLTLFHDNFAITSCILPNVCNIWVKCSWSNSIVFVVITPFVFLIVNDNKSTGWRSVANWKFI